jgi:hypothetical protein
MQRELVAIIVILGAPLAIGQEPLPKALSGRAATLPYTQIVRDGGISIGLTTKVGDANFKPYFAEILSSLRKAKDLGWPWSVEAGSVEVEGTILRDGWLKALSVVDPSLDNTKGVRLDPNRVEAVLKVTRALGSLSPFEPLPQEYIGDRIGVHFAFTPEKSNDDINDR